MKVDPFNPENGDKPLWVVYGHDAFPSILCCKIRHNHADLGPIIWGFSIYKRSPGFRTLGLEVQTWIDRYHMAKFFDDHAEAIAYITKLTTPMGAK